MAWKVGLVVGAVNSGSGSNTTLKDSSFVEVTGDFSSSTTANTAATAMLSSFSGLFVFPMVWEVA